jgi:hypothetical protein
MDKTMSRSFLFPDGRLFEVQESATLAEQAPEEDASGAVSGR